MQSTQRGRRSPAKRSVAGPGMSCHRLTEPRITPLLNVCMLTRLRATDLSGLTNPMASVFKASIAK
jgi:hypothetical protein